MATFAYKLVATFAYKLVANFAIVLVANFAIWPQGLAKFLKWTAKEMPTVRGDLIYIVGSHRYRL